MTHEALQKAFDVLKELGGYFVVQDAMGEEFVIMRRGDIAGREDFGAEAGETQLSLAEAPVNNSADEVLERINEELALYQLQQTEQRFLEETEMADSMSPKNELPGDQGEATYEAVDKVQPPPVRIRFEPLHGDLSPDLQE